MFVKLDENWNFVYTWSKENGICYKLVIEPVHGLYLAAYSTDFNIGWNKLLIYDASNAWLPIEQYIGTTGTKFTDLTFDINGYLVLIGYDYFSIRGPSEVFVLKTDFEIGDSECHDFYGQAVEAGSTNW